MVSGYLLDPHLDRGAQYRSTLFGHTLREAGLIPSMGRRGSALDNAACESVMASFKTEFVHRRSFKSRDQAREAVFRWIEGWYNPRRRHSSLGYRSPNAFEALHASTLHDWQDDGVDTGDRSPSQEPAMALPLPENGPYGPADRDRPALEWGAPATVGHHADQSHKASTEMR